VKIQEVLWHNEHYKNSEELYILMSRTQVGISKTVNMGVIINNYYISTINEHKMLKINRKSLTNYL